MSSHGLLCFSCLNVNMMLIKTVWPSFCWFYLCSLQKDTPVFLNYLLQAVSSDIHTAAVIAILCVQFVWFFFNKAEENEKRGAAGQGRTPHCITCRFPPQQSLSLLRKICSDALLLSNPLWQPAERRSKRAVLSSSFSTSFSFHLLSSLQDWKPCSLGTIQQRLHNGSGVAARRQYCLAAERRSGGGAWRMEGLRESPTVPPGRIL